jgi:hypothetical protein
MPDHQRNELSWREGMPLSRRALFAGALLFRAPIKISEKIPYMKQGFALARPRLA